MTRRSDPAASDVLGACPLCCPDACSWIVSVRDGAAVGLRGNPDHPFTRGTLCVKVNRYLEHAAAPDRLLHPLRRVGSKGEGRFERVSWDDALDEIATRLTAIVDTYGGEAVWPFQGMGAMGYLQGMRGLAGRRFFNTLGASKHDANICSSAGNAGVRYVLGTPGGMDPEDLRHAGLILLWGTNTLTSGHHLWRFVRDSGAYVVAIDPVRTRTADQADEHVAPLPGTDAALALGLLNVVVGLGAQDDDFIARHTVGWPEFRTRIEAFPPDVVASITGVPAERIVALGTRIARTRPTAIRAAQGLQRHAGGGTTLRTLACIPGVTGDWHRPGGGLVYSTTAHFPLDKAALQRDDLLPHPVRTLHATELAAGLLDRDDPPVHALVVNGANPVASNPDRRRVIDGLSRSDLFTVVVEQFPTETVDYADIVLPTTTQLEHTDLVSGYGNLYLLWNEPAVAPPGECLSSTEIFRRLAARMRLAPECLYDSDVDLAAAALGAAHPWLDGVTVESLRATGWARLRVPDPFLPFRDGFPTESGRLEFVSARAAADGLDPVAGYVPPVEVADTTLAARRPFALVSSASHFFMNSYFGNNAELRRRSGPPKVSVHPVDAAAWGLVDGLPARVASDRGSFVATVAVSDKARPGTAVTAKGYWAKLDGAGTHVNDTVAERSADMAHGAVYHDTRVSIEPLALDVTDVSGARPPAQRATPARAGRPRTG